MISLVGTVTTFVEFSSKNPRENMCQICNSACASSEWLYTRWWRRPKMSAKDILPSTTSSQSWGRTRIVQESWSPRDIQSKTAQASTWSGRIYQVACWHEDIIETSWQSICCIGKLILFEDNIVINQYSILSFGDPRNFVLSPRRSWNSHHNRSSRPLIHYTIMTIWLKHKAHKYTSQYVESHK